ncbi:MAG TPA: hypothetical protein VGP68_07440 [Gemmataceae bacterium]|nr:hypothetical protein [Gemmataceae bacterium]
MSSSYCVVLPLAIAQVLTQWQASLLPPWNPAHKRIGEFLPTRYCNSGLLRWLGLLHIDVTHQGNELVNTSG